MLHQIRELGEMRCKSVYMKLKIKRKKSRKIVPLLEYDKCLFM
jgi:hypothetical protein